MSCLYTVIRALLWLALVQGSRVVAFPTVGYPGFHMTPIGIRLRTRLGSVFAKSPRAACASSAMPGWSNDPDVVFVPDSPSSGSSPLGTFHNFYQATKDGSNNAPWSAGETGVWRHASTRNWTVWEDHGHVVGSENWGTGTVVVAPAAASSPGSFVRTFPGGPGIGLGVSNVSTLRGPWADWPTSAVPPIPSPANGFEGDPFLFWEVSVLATPCACVLRP